MNSIDILGLGAVAIDDLLYVPSYPGSDTKMLVSRQERQCGGLTATALVAASRLGTKCAYAGALGADDASEYAIRCMADENIDVSHVIRRAGARPIRSVIIVDETSQTRNIFFNVNGVIGADPEGPDAELIRSAKVLFLDHIGMEGMLRAAIIAHQAKIPIVADLEGGTDSPEFGQLLAVIDHLILSEEFAFRVTGESTRDQAVRRLWSPDRQAVIVTAGADGCWMMTPSDDAPVHIPAFRVHAKDTTGCGDVFHGAYASALARGLDVSERVRMASAAAAIKATRHGGQQGAPNLAEVEQFLRRVVKT